MLYIRNGNFGWLWLVQWVKDKYVKQFLYFCSKIVILCATLVYSIIIKLLGAL